MAIYSYSMRGRVSRGAGKSSVGAAAYLCRAQFRDQRTGQIFDWRQPERTAIGEASAYIERSDGDHGSRQELLYSGLYGPPDAPEWTRGQEHIQPRSAPAISRCRTSAPNGNGWFGKLAATPRKGPRAPLSTHGAQPKPLRSSSAAVNCGSARGAG
jgi:hypothetical protein